MSSQKRLLDVCVISDVHLGTIGCHAKELRSYLKSIEPKILILNGDIIDIWNFRQRYFPKSHLKVLQKIMEMAADGTKVYYLTGNHDEMLRRFTDYEAGSIYLRNKLLLELDGKKAWIFHGDIFDLSIQNAKWLAKIGGWGYDMLIWLNRMLNFVLTRLGYEPYSMSKKIKNSVKKALKYIADFEQTASELAIEYGYDYVICGHIHQPQFREVYSKKGSVTYLNSGDWVENLTALEYQNQKWTIYYHPHEKEENEKEESIDISSSALFAQILHSH
jgi:UDP-2,3-diacylglucosamine pyrophosphatase LpxH